MYCGVTHNKYYETFESFTDAVFEFFENILPENWEIFKDTITDNYRVISTKQYKMIRSKGKPDKIHLCVIRAQDSIGVHHMPQSKLFCD